MKKTDTAVLIEGLRRLSADAAQIADALEGKKEEAVQKLNTALEGNFSPLNHASPEGIRKLLSELK